MFRKVLIANRGEIALRIQRACADMGLKTVAVHSEIDSNAMHVRLADESVCIGPARSKDSYLNIQSVLSAAEITNVDAIHPGVGFLSENERFAEMVETHGFTFIGPTAEHIRVMGDKITAKEMMISVGIPVVPGSKGAVNDMEELRSLCKEMGFPVLIKAAGGGGGKGMRVARSLEDLEAAWRDARNEAQACFGNNEVYVEKYLERPRHIEVQIIADHHGNVVHLGERDCSVQRRHQKIWEEAPCSALSAKEREALGELVATAIKKIGYRGVGTIEFLYEDGKFYFIEMNTRLQVEHPITECVTGIDLVREQIRVASGLPLSFSQKDVEFKGHAIECRINAEHPETFMPSPGKITEYLAPGGYGVRVESALYAGYSVPPTYDSLVGKLVVTAQTREECIARLRRALQEYVISGIETTLPLHRLLVENKEIQKGDFDIHWLEREFLKNT